MPVDLPSLESQLANLRDSLRLWVAISNADPSKAFGGSRYLQREAAANALQDIVMTLRRLGDKGHRDKQDRPRELDLLSVYRALEDHGRKDIGDSLVRAPHFQHIKKLADKLFAHGKPQDLKGFATFDPSLPQTHIQASMVFEVSKAFCDAYTTHVQSVDLDGSEYHDRRRRDPFEEAIQPVGLPLVDFPPADIFLDRSFLPKDFLRKRVPFTDEQILRYIRFYHSRAKAAGSSFTNDLLSPEAANKYLQYSVELLERQPLDQHERVVASLRTEGVLLPTRDELRAFQASKWDPSRYYFVPAELVRQDQEPDEDLDE